MMFEADAIEFPFVASLPKRKQSAILRTWAVLNKMREVYATKGVMVPQQLAAKVLNLSQQRVTQLREAGKLESVDIDGHPFITEESLVAWAQSEKRTGRPPKGPQTAKECWKMAREYAQGR